MTQSQLKMPTTICLTGLSVDDELPKGGNFAYYGRMGRPTG